MSAGTQDIEDDVTLVEAAAEEKQQKSRDEAIAKVEKILGGESKAPTKKVPAKAEEKKPDGEEKPAVEVATDEPDEFSQAMKDRAKEAGLTESLAERLHQSGLLEEALATFDRSLIEHAAKRQPEKKVEEPPKKADLPPKADVEVKRDGSAPPPLKAEDYDEDLVKRDAYFETRIAELTEKLERLSGLADGFDRQRDSQFQGWFAKTAAELNKELFGDGLPAQESPEYKNRQSLCDGYERICEARGLDPYDCHAEMLKRAYPAMFQTEVFKAAQREMVKRLRDAEGKFLEPTRRSSGMPKTEKRQTSEEARAEDLAKIDAILKKSKT